MTNEEKIDVLFQRIANTALQVTPIVFLPKPPSAIPLGCGLYLRIRNDYFLISAGHLLNLKDWPSLMVPGNNDKMVWLKGAIVTTYKDSDTMNEIDFGVLKFSSKQIKHLISSNLAFMNPENIIINHKVEKNGYYVIAGYPVSGVKKTSGKTEFSPIPVKFLTYPLQEKSYKKHKFNPDHFILVKYQRRLAEFGSRQKYITKEIKGISGSGLWYIPSWNEMKKGIPRFYLVGIMTENYKDKGFLVALRIDFITSTINQVFNPLAFDHTLFDFGNKIDNIYGSEL